MSYFTCKWSQNKTLYCFYIIIISVSNLYYSKLYLNKDLSNNDSSLLDKAFILLRLKYKQFKSKRQACSRNRNKLNKIFLLDFNCTKFRLSCHWSGCSKVDAQNRKFQIQNKNTVACSISRVARKCSKTVKSRRTGFEKRHTTSCHQVVTGVTIR